MKKVFGLVFSFFFFAILLVATSKEKMAWLQNVRGNTAFSSQKYKFGDLYGFSYFSQFKIPATEAMVVKPKHYNSIRNISLFGIVDSYIYSSLYSDSILNGVKKYKYVTWGDNQSLNCILDTSEFNVLLVESTERELMDRFLDTIRISQKMSFTKEKQEGKQEEKQEDYSSLFEDWLNSLYNPNIESNLEICLFDYAIFNPFKEIKASIKRQIFNKIPPLVELSTDNKYLFYQPTVAEDLKSSSFCNIDSNEVNRIVGTVNYINLYASRLGFDKVFISLIPNPASIVDTVRNGKLYNKLIPKIQNHPNLRADIIDTYSPFKKATFQVYRNSDSHWNKDGFNTWLYLFNEKLDKYIHQKDSLKSRTRL